MTASTFERRRYRCDSSHLWSVRVLIGSAEPEEHTSCRICGGEAITMRREVPTDRVVLSVESAEQVRDRPGPDPGDLRKFYVVMSDVNGRELRRTAHHIDLDAALELVRRCAGKEPVAALAEWDRDAPRGR